MKPFWFAAFALVLMSVAHARPVVLEEAAILPSPDPSWTYLGRFGVAIDGDYALVSAERYPPSPWEPGTVVHEAAALLYQRSGTSWNYVGTLGGVTTIPDDIPNGSYPGLAMRGGIAMTIMGGAKIFERVGTTWTQAPLPSELAFSLRGKDIEIDGGRILVPRDTCDYRSAVLRKINGAWSIEGESVGTDHRCSAISPLLSTHDLSGDHAVIYFPFDGVESERVRRLIFEPGTGWRLYGGADITTAFDTPFGPQVAASGGFFAVTASAERGSVTGYPATLDDGQEIGAWSHYGLQPVDSYLQLDAASTTVLEHAGPLFAQRNYSHDRGAYVYNLFRMNEDPRTATFVATLQSASGSSLGEDFDSDGTRAIARGRMVVDGRWAGDNTVRVFQIPASLETPAVQNHDFESATAGAAWQTAGGAFSFANVGFSRVYRQGSIEGNPAAWLPESPTTNQSIQSEVTIRALPGSNSWVGLATRRSDASNYYYVTLRSGGTLELKRMLGGVFTTLASAAAPVSVNRKYRLRLESIGTTHRVYRDDRLIMKVNDSTLESGAAGIIMNRASADYDNVIVTPSPFTTIYTRNFSSSRLGNWNVLGTNWQSVDGVFRQTYPGDYAYATVGADTDDQIVSVRVRPTLFVEPDNWVGLLLRDRGDYRNHAYVSLRGRGVISLWRRTNGAIQQLGTRNIPVSTGTWYDLRVEVVGGLTRVFVNNELQISSNAELGPTADLRGKSMGRVGLITRKATADFDDFRAYQP
jgi:hypothetical protein